MQAHYYKDNIGGGENEKKDIQILKFGLKEIHILQPWVIPVTIINSFLNL